MMRMLLLLVLIQYCMQMRTRRRAGQLRIRYPLAAATVDAGTAAQGGSRRKKQIHEGAEGDEQCTWDRNAQEIMGRNMQRMRMQMRMIDDDDGGC